MKPIQLMLIGVAFVAAVAAGFIMMNLTAPPQVVDLGEPVAPQIELERVLVAANTIPMGTELNGERLAWQDWPASGVRGEFIVEADRPEAIDEMSEAVARTTFFAGEPIREEKLVRSDSGYLSAILPAGKQAVAIRIQAERAAGGFILPNDYVDVIMTYEDDKQDWITERVLTNVRVLAIDQLIEEQNGEKTQIGETATLELSPEQVEILSVSNSISDGELTLALRSVEDSGDGDGGASHLVQNGKKKHGPIRLIRFGSTEMVRKTNN